MAQQPNRKAAKTDPFTQRNYDGFIQLLKIP